MLNCPEDGRVYGCLYCRANKERTVARGPEEALPGVRGIVASREKHRVSDGARGREEEIFLPGYVFFEAPGDMNARGLCAPPPVSNNIIRVLSNGEGNRRLSGDDERFAVRLLRCGGLLRFSSARRDTSCRYSVLSCQLNSL